MADRQRILSVSIHDCVVQTMKAHGPGGQNVNKRETAVRVTHPPSGATAVCRESRKQADNKRTAFLRMVETPKFKLWLRRKLGNEALLEDQVNRSMQDHNIRTEVKDNGKWTVISSDDELS